MAISTNKKAGSRLVTMQEVSHKAGVSTSTVSHVINSTRFVSEETRGKVQAAILELNYYPNKHARGLATGKSYSVGLLISDITNPFFPQIVRSVEEGALKSGYDIILCDTNYSSNRASAYITRFIEHNVDGAIILTTETDEKLISRLVERNVPVVLLDWGIVSDCVCNIREDFETGIDEAIHYLIEFGHEKIGFISGPDGFKTVEARKAAFIKATTNQKIPIETFLAENQFTMCGGWQAMDDLFSQPHMPTAIIASNDLMAIGAMKRIKECGLKIPDQISVIGIDDIDIASTVEPQLTSIHIPRRQIGQTAWKQLMGFIKNQATAGREEIIKTCLIKRASTGPASP
jgi:DNA-binding LacI/PurR family transcriptional regulator